jgi:trehalose 6-phosphate phosphatase
LGPEIEIWGVHGAERTLEGSVALTDRARPYRELMEGVKREAAEALQGLDLPGASLEDKGIMLGLHFRAAEDRVRAMEELDRLADDLAARHGLLRAGGRLAYELRPPIEFSKAAVVLERSRELGLTAAAFFGDDRVDLPGFDALDILATEGVATLRVAVRSDEAPPEILERADVVVEGPSGALDLLRALLPA